MSDIWTEIFDITGVASEDLFGQDVSLSGDGRFLAIGSPGTDSDNPFLIDVGAHNELLKPGEVQVYDYLNNDWILKGSPINGLLSADGPSNEDFGWSIDLSDDGNRVAIGDPSYDLTSQSNVGFTSVYQFGEGDWERIGNTIIGVNTNSALGYSVQLSSDGSLLGIGSPEIDGGADKSGFTSIYQLQDNQWNQLGDNILGEENTDESGASISLVSPNEGTIDGSLIAIGAQKNDGDNLINSGHVRVFQYDAGNWIQYGNDIDGTRLGDLSSSDISLSDDGRYLAVGSIKHDYSGNDDSGQVRIFEFDQNTSIWRQSGFDIGGSLVGEQFGTSVSLSSDGQSLAVGANKGGINNSGEASIFDLDETTYPVEVISTNNNNSLLRFKYSLLNSATGEIVKGINLWTEDDNIDDSINTNSYDLVIEAKTTSEDKWNLETFDITLNLVDNLFSNWSSNVVIDSNPYDEAIVHFDPSVNSAKSVEKLDSSYFVQQGIDGKEGVRITGAVLDNLNDSTEEINGKSYQEIFKIKGLKFNENLQRGGTISGQTLAIDIDANSYETIVSNYQDTDNNGINDNAYISSLSELGFSESKKAVEIDRTNEIYTYQTYTEMIDHGTTLWTERETGTISNSFLVRNGSTVNARSWWSNIGNFESELNKLEFSNVYSLNDGNTITNYSESELISFAAISSNSFDIDTVEEAITSLTNNGISIDSGQLTFITAETPINLSTEGENTVMGYNVNGVHSDGSANSWDDTSESFSVELKVKVDGTEGQLINAESFYSISGDNFKDNKSILNNSSLISSNVITFAGDINYDGRVSLIDVAYLNAGKLRANSNSDIAPEDIDPNFDKEITLADLEVLSKDFQKSIHNDLDHHASWDEVVWSVPINQVDGNKGHLSIGTLEEGYTLIDFDNTSFIRQENIIASGLAPDSAIIDM